jgi:hypothetical protein
LQKVIGHPFDHFACGICELHATPFMLAIYRWESFIQEKTKWRRVKNSVHHPWFLYPSRLIQLYHFQANPIWCDGTFKHKLIWCDGTFNMMPG